MERFPEFSFVIIKPDAMARGLVGKIIQRFEEKNLQIEWSAIRHKSAEWAKKHYSNHANKTFFPALVSFMSSAPVMGLVFTGPEVTRMVKQLVGSTDPFEAVPGTIRADFGFWPPRYNCVHCSDHTQVAQKEFDLFNDESTDE